MRLLAYMRFIRNNYKKILILLILIVCLVGIKTYFFSSKQTYTTAVVTRGDVYETLTISGSIQAENKATLQFQTSGLLSYLAVSEGMSVKKNQTIASLDTRSVRKNIDKSLNDYLTNRWTFEQTHDNYKDSLVTDTIKRTLETSQFSLNNAVLAVELQDLALKLSTISAPFDGIITQISGAVVGTNTSLLGTTFTIIDPNSLYFDLSVDQTDVTKLSEGMQSSLVLDSFPDSTISGSIKRISFAPKTGEINTVYSIVIAFDPAEANPHAIRIGMTGDATFILNKSLHTLLLPLKFVKEDAKGSYVLTGEKRIKVPITTGLIGENDVEVIGIPEGTVVYD